MRAKTIYDNIKEHNKTIASIRTQSKLLNDMSLQIIEAFKNQGKLYLIGNGGSAADAQHIAAEFIGRFKQNRMPLPAIALTTDTSVLTAVANDFGTNDIFVRQVEALVTNKDIVWALSVSGNSPNVIKAMQMAKYKKAKCFGFTGKNGWHLEDLCDLCFIVDHEDSDRVQEAHQFAYHWICGKVEEHFWALEDSKEFI